MLTAKSLESTDSLKTILFKNITVIKYYNLIFDCVRLKYFNCKRYENQVRVNKFYDLT